MCIEKIEGNCEIITRTDVEVDNLDNLATLKCKFVKNNCTTDAKIIYIN